MRRRLILGALALSSALATPMVLADRPTGNMLAGSCAACHGTNGNSVSIMPSLAGMNQEYFKETMEAFKDGSRKATVMDRIAKGYDDADIKAMGNYFAAQKPKPMQQSFMQTKASTGGKLHKQYCEKCHENGGRPGDSDMLAGQWMPYLDFSIADFIAGKRPYPRKMKRKVDAALDAHGDQAVAALVNYYGSQH